MEAVQSLNNIEVMVNQVLTREVLHRGNQFDPAGTYRAVNDLLAEGGESYYNYVKSIGLIKDHDMVVLSSVHHYYFDGDDLKNTGTVINLKQLNLIRDLGLFLQSIFKIIPHRSNFIGCFHDNKIQNKFRISNILSQYHNNKSVDPFENGIISRIPFLNNIYNLMDSKTDRSLSARDVTLFLEKEGFIVLNMTEIKGLTYFHSQKIMDSRFNMAV